MTDNVIEGVFRNGHVELSRMPEGVDEARVLVTFLGDPAPAQKTDAEREQAARELIESMRQSKMTGGRGYTNREELYGDRLTRFDR